MKSKALIKLVIVCLVVFGLIISINNLVRGMNKADLVEKMAGEVVLVFQLKEKTNAKVLSPAQIWGIPPI